MELRDTFISVVKSEVCLTFHNLYFHEVSEDFSYSVVKANELLCHKKKSSMHITKRKQGMWRDCIPCDSNHDTLQKAKLYTWWRDQQFLRGEEGGRKKWTEYCGFQGCEVIPWGIKCLTHVMKVHKSLGNLQNKERINKFWLWDS